MTLEDDFAEVQSQLRALFAGPPGVRTRARTLEVRCTACGKLAAEGWATQPWTSVTWDDATIGGLGVLLDVNGEAWPPTELVVAECRCAKHSLVPETLLNMSNAPRRGRQPNKVKVNPHNRKIGERGWRRRDTPGPDGSE